MINIGGGIKYHAFIFYLLTMKKFKTVKEWIEFWENFNWVFGTTWRMHDYYYNKLEKAWELNCDWKYKKKNEVLWDMLGDWEFVQTEIDDDLRAVYNEYHFPTEQDKLDWLNGMLEMYEWYLQW